MSLGPYSPKAPCPKCGNSEVKTNYCDGKTPVYGSPCFRRREKDEHLHRVCFRCNYHWLEACVQPSTPAGFEKAHDIVVTNAIERVNRKREPELAAPSFLECGRKHDL